MNGRRYLLDTNAMIQLLQGNEELVSLVRQAGFLATSIIAEMEFLSFSGLTKHDEALFRVLKSRIQVHDVPSDSSEFTKTVVDMRKRFNLKLPDAIIAGTAIVHNLVILTADNHFKKENAPWRFRTVFGQG